MSAMNTARIWFVLVALSCAGLLGYALYVQHVDFLDPCPLCILQRVAFIWMGLLALAAAVHNPGPDGRWAYAAGITLGGVAGTLISGRHVWLQSLPPEDVPECGMGLNYMLETLPVSEVLSQVFHGSGECAQVDWTFLGLSMPAWTLIWYIGMTMVTLLVVLMNRAPRGRKAGK